MKIQQDLLKNDVPAQGQLDPDECVFISHNERADIKLLFLGNSITRHGKKPDIGWYGDYGMAASCEQNDYVHRLIGMLERDGKKPSYCVCNMSEWESSWDDALLDARYGKAKLFGADVVIVRLGENAKLLDRAAEFMPHYENLITHFAGDGARVAVTDLFWEYEPFDALVKALAKDKGYRFAQIHDLGNSDEMKATGMFEHAGVAAHPSDKGMQNIAERIYRAAFADM